MCASYGNVEDILQHAASRFCVELWYLQRAPPNPPPCAWQRFRIEEYLFVLTLTAGSGSGSKTLIHRGSLIDRLCLARSLHVCK